MLIDLDPDDKRPYELVQKPHRLLYRVRHEISEITASGLEEVMCGKSEPRDIAFEPFEIRGIRALAEDIGMESPV